ncbi:MAG TPA: acetylornithine transaminase [Nitrospiria bacterium]|nr:acetylornithine transaminase [Nitrospiria bacterium]
MVQTPPSHQPAAATSALPSGADCLMSTYLRSPLLLVSGHGVRVNDQTGRSYLDFVGGVAVNVLGHCHPHVVEAVRTQAERLMHVSNLYFNEPQLRLAQELVGHSFADQVFFCNSGAEAVEAAVKLARKWAKQHRPIADGEAAHEILAMEGSFHGRTMGALSATGQPKLQQGFEPLLPGFRHLPYNDLDAVARSITPRTAAVIVEPIQGEGGVRIPSPGYLTGLRRLCTERGILLIFDEVQTGVGRTGRLFAYQHESASGGAAPDLMTLAKGLGGGLPIGALLATRRAAECFTPGSHASTFGGNPLVCSAALATLDVIHSEGLLPLCHEMGDYLLGRLQVLRSRRSIISEVRGKGLLVGIELLTAGRPIMEACLAEGLLINVTAERVLRLMPPLIVTRHEIDEAVAILDRVLSTADV